MGYCWFVSICHSCDGWRLGNGRQCNNLFLLWSRRTFYFHSKEIISLYAFVALLLRPWVLFVFLPHFKFGQLNLEALKKKNYDGKHFPSCSGQIPHSRSDPGCCRSPCSKIGAHLLQDSVWNPNARGHKGRKDAWCAQDTSSMASSDFTGNTKYWAPLCSSSLCTW